MDPFLAFAAAGIFSLAMSCPALAWSGFSKESELIKGPPFLLLPPSNFSPWKKRRGKRGMWVLFHPFVPAFLPRGRKYGICPFKEMPLSLLCLWCEILVFSSTEIGGSQTFPLLTPRYLLGGGATVENETNAHFSLSHGLGSLSLSLSLSSLLLGLD